MSPRYLLEVWHVDQSNGIQSDGFIGGQGEPIHEFKTAVECMPYIEELFRRMPDPAFALEIFATITEQDDGGNNVNQRLFTVYDTEFGRVSMASKKGRQLFTDLEARQRKAALRKAVRELIYKDGRA